MVLRNRLKSNTDIYNEVSDDREIRWFYNVLPAFIMRYKALIVNITVKIYSISAFEASLHQNLFSNIPEEVAITAKIKAAEESPCHENADFKSGNNVAASLIEDEGSEAMIEHYDDRDIREITCATYSSGSAFAMSAIITPSPLFSFHRRWFWICFDRRRAFIWQASKSKVVHGRAKAKPITLRNHEISMIMMTHIYSIRM